MVLIVAKCNVNGIGLGGATPYSDVLIVAKCNVNGIITYAKIKEIAVLIVAKCNVNINLLINLGIVCSCINSSKV